MLSQNDIIVLMLSTNMIQQLVALSLYQFTVFEQHYCLIIVHCELLCLFYGLFVLYDLLKGNLFRIDIIFLGINWDNCVADIKVMIICWRTLRFEQFARRYSSSVKLGHRTPRTGCNRLRRENSGEMTLLPLPLSFSSLPFSGRRCCCYACGSHYVTQGL